MNEEKTQPKTKQTDTLNKQEFSYEAGVANAVKFLKNILKKEGDLIKAIRTDSEGWEVIIEVVEQSEYMKKLGISKPVYDKNIYCVILDKNCNVISYERKLQKSSYQQQQEA